MLVLGYVYHLDGVAGGLDGTTNIAMLTVTGLWAQLEIGDRTNKFTGTPAIGTNAATYGDYPWRIYVTNLVERYKVLNALTMTRRVTPGTNQQYRIISTGGAFDDVAGYNELVTAFNDVPWTNGTGVPGFDEGESMISANVDNHDTGPWTMFRVRGSVVIGLLSTNLSVNSYKIYLQIHDQHRYYGTDTAHFLADDGMGTEENYKLWVSLPGTTELPYISDVIGDVDAPLTLGPYFPAVFFRTWFISDAQVYTDWQFNYCTNK